MSKPRIAIFEGNTAEKVEDSVNNFIKEETIEFIDARYSVAITQDESIFSVMVVYKDEQLS